MLTNVDRPKKAPQRAADQEVGAAPLAAVQPMVRQLGAVKPGKAASLPLSDPGSKLVDGILYLAAGYGSADRFWFENLDFNANPHAIWRALMVFWARRDDKIADHATLLLKSPSSRVRAWACRYLAAIDYSPAFLDLFVMTNDPSPRVRVAARQSVVAFKPMMKADLLLHHRIRLARYSVLVSEDDPLDRLRLEDLLAKQGYRVLSASSEIETIGIARKARPHFLVTDNQKLDGDVIDNLCGLNMTWDLCRQSDLREMVTVMISPTYLEPVFLWQGGDIFLQSHDPANPLLLDLLKEYVK